MSVFVVDNDGDDYCDDYDLTSFDIMLVVGCCLFLVVVVFLLIVFVLD
jgi:hypothetical protein